MGASQLLFERVEAGSREHDIDAVKSFAAQGRRLNAKPGGVDPAGPARRFTQLFRIDAAKPQIETLGGPRRARSAGVRTTSNTGQTPMKAFCRREFEGPQRMVHVAGVKARVPSGNGVRLAPPCLTAEKPFVVALRRVLRSRLVVLHDTRMMPQLRPPHPQRC